MRRRFWIRHLIVGAIVAGFALLGARGVIGKLNFSKIDQWQVNVRPDPAGGLRITETIDLDLADDPGHGLQLATGTEFGRPQDLRVTSPDAPADVTTSDVSGELLIRIGDPDIEIVGQHRYDVSYRLPDAPTGIEQRLALDVMVGSPLDTDEFRATLVGVELDSPRCYRAKRGGSGRCAIKPRAGGGYEVWLTDLDSGSYVTIEGRIVNTFESASPVPALPPPRREYRNQRLFGLATGAAALVGAIVSYLWCRGRGRNRVIGDGSAAEATAIPFGPSPRQPVPTTDVSDARLASMATVEFEPPPNIEPWEGLVLLTERFVKPDIFNAYLSGLAGSGAIEIAPAPGGVSISAGPNIDQTLPEDRRHVDAILAIRNPYLTGRYDPRFKTIYADVRNDLHQRLVQRRWWSRGTPRQRMGKLDRTLLTIWLAFFVGIVMLIPLFIVGVLMHFFATFAIGVSALVGLVTAWFAYRPLLPARTAAGSAFALRTESFRRFLDASEAPQVEWAWEHHLLREYSGWAIALGEASGWSAAIDAAARSQPAVAASAAGPLLLHRSRRSISRSMARVPTGGGSGGRGSFSRGSIGGGRAGGGGGGSRAGRW